MNAKVKTQNDASNTTNISDVAEAAVNSLFESRQQELALLESEKTLALEPAPSIKGIMKVHGAGSDNLWKVPLAGLSIVPGHNPRVMTARYKARIRAMADSMISEGWYPNSVLMGYAAKDRTTGEETIVITAGHTRFLAVKLANADMANMADGEPILDVPVVVKMKGVSMDDIQVELIRGNGDGSLTAYETAIVCQRMYRAGHTLANIEKRTGVKDPWLSKMLKLMSAPEKLKQLVAYEIVAASFAIEMIDQYGLEALSKIQEALANKYPGVIVDPGADPAVVASAEVFDAATGAKVEVVDDGAGKAPTSQIKITMKDINRSSDFDKKVRKFAPSLATALQNVKNDPGYASLSVGVREELAKLADDLEKLKKKLEGAESKGADAGESGETK